MHFYCYSRGDLKASVCTDLTDTAATAAMQLEDADAVGPWRIADEPFGADTDTPVPNGSPCPQGTPGARHVLFVRGPA